MLKEDTISAKEIRTDLMGFLKRVKTGRPITVIYRSKPYVTINSYNENIVETPGSSAALKRSIVMARLLRQSTTQKQTKTYHELLDEKYNV